MAIRDLRLLLVCTATALATAMSPTSAGTAVAAPSPGASEQSTVSVRTVRLPGLPGSTGSTQAKGINGAGTTVGWATAGNGVPHAVIWRGTRIEDLGLRHPSDSSSAADVSDEGLIVGTALEQAVLWQSGQEHWLPRPPDPHDGFIYSCAATSVDRSGRIGGYCNVDVNSSVVAMAVRWVDRTPVREWYPGAINAMSPSGAVRAGQVFVDFENNIVAAVQDAQGPRRLPELVPGAVSSRALGVNDAGLVVGQSAGHAVTWRDGAVSPLRAAIPGGTGSATAVNRWGNVVGTQGGEGDSFPTMWKNGVPFSLGGRGVATALNDVGQVAGWATDHRGRTTAVRWKVTGTP